MGAEPAQHSAYVAVAAERSDDWVHLASRVLEENILTRADVAYRCQCIRCYRGQAYIDGSLTPTSEIGTPTANASGRSVVSETLAALCDPSRQGTLRQATAFHGRESPKFSIGSHRIGSLSDVENAADQVRTSWGLGFDPIGNDQRTRPARLALVVGAKRSPGRW